MKNIALLIIAISFSTFLQAQQVFTKQQQEVQQTVVQLFEALSNRDSISLKTYCSSDVVFYEYGQLWNIDTLIQKGITLNKAVDFKRTNSIDFINITIDKKLAWLTYRLTSAITKEGKQTNLHWLETVVLTKHKKKWKVKHLHSTLIKRN